jgi:hypothetical protein
MARQRKLISRPLTCKRTYTLPVSAPQTRILDSGWPTAGFADAAALLATADNICVASSRQLVQPYNLYFCLAPTCRQFVQPGTNKRQTQIGSDLLRASVPF